jgi:hypothetical protein
MPDPLYNLYYSFMGKAPSREVHSPDGRAAQMFDTLQRAEEYYTAVLDDNGRFPAEASARHKSGLTDLPEVDVFFDSLFPGAYAKEYAYSCVPTFDIDNAFAFKAKGVWKNGGGMLKNILTDPSRALRRLAVWMNTKPDPYDTYEYILNTCASFGLRPLFFIQMGNYANGYDTNIPFDKQAGRELIQFLSERAEIGLHPSFASNADNTLLRKEYELLSELVGKPVTRSRQHYLKLRFPDTYRNLIALGITEDYSMGWASQTGFRAGTCRPFLWFDKEKKEFTKLKIFPFACMDGTLHEYLHLSPREAVDKASDLIEKTRRHQGVFTPLWHNHSVNNLWEWKGWQPVFEQMLALARP